MDSLIILIGIGCFCAGVAGGFILRYIFAKMYANSVEQKSDTILNEAKIKAESQAKERLIKANEEAEKSRKEAEKEIKEKKVEIQNVEKRLNQREENIDKKMDLLDRKERDLQQKEKNIDTKEKNIEQKITEVENIKNEQKAVLEKISGLTRENAKAMLLKEM